MAASAATALVLVSGCSAGSPSTAPTSTPEPVPVPEGWRLVWHAEFDGDSLDPSRWRAEHRSTFGDGNGELACLMDRPANIRVADGVLDLTARREASLVCGDDDRFPGGRRYSSAMLSTRGLAAWDSGRFEVHAKLPLAAGRSQGLWPAFWLRPVDGGPGELDVLEAVGTGPGDAGPAEVVQTLWGPDGEPQQSSRYAPEGFDPSAGFHTYSVDWDPTSMVFSVDGRVVWERSTATTPWLPETFGRPYFARLNLAVGGRWPGEPTAQTDLPAAFEVDWVRVYQRTDGAPQTGGAG